MNNLVSTSIARLASENLGTYIVQKTFVELPERAVVEARTSGAKRVIIKVDSSPHRLKHEVLVLAACSVAVPVPTIIHFIPAAPSVLVMSAIEGAGLSASSSDEVWKAAGATLAKIHKVVVPTGLGMHTVYTGWDTFSAQMKGESKSDASALVSLVSPHDLDRIRITVEEALSSESVGRPVLIHGDCQPDHFICRSDRISGVIDFGDAGRGDPVWDISVLSLYCPDKLDPLLAGYAPSADTRNRITKTLQAYWLVRLIGEIAWLQGKRLQIDKPVERLHQLLK
jgi:aminoglycoside phosphotransferase (APT) family kinase protein